VQTPRFCGHACIAGTLLRFTSGLRGLRISWLTVGILARLLDLLFKRKFSRHFFSKAARG
jgi:hypothetical protein